MSVVKILIGADLVPTKTNEESFIKADVDKLADEKLREVLKEADYRIFNLEVPLTDKRTPISKNGPNLIAPSKTVNGIKAFNVDFLTLANNHILDQGKIGLASTEKALQEAGINYAGVGNTAKEASRPYIAELGGKKIGIYCCAEREFSIVTDKSAGANPFDPLESLDQISELREKTDYLIVLYHGGKEHYRYPSPYLQKVCRKIAEKGADLVICQHTHCIGCEEKINNSTIVYGQGNFLFDDCDNEYWLTSLLVEVELGSEACVRYIPLCKNGSSVRLAQGEEKEKILSDFFSRSEQIKREGFIEERYNAFADEMIENYLAAFQGKKLKRFIFRAINKLSGYRFAKKVLKRAYGKKELLAVENFINCEAHRELVLKGIQGRI